MEPKECCPSVSRTDERCVLPVDHDGCHQAEPSIPLTCATVWMDALSNSGARNAAAQALSSALAVG
jgi:hypothetical protein